MSEKIVNIEVERLVKCPLNLRTTFRDLESLGLTMQKTIVTPLIVRESPTGEGQYETVFGERRRQAGTSVGLETLPCIVREITDDEALDMMLIEDEQRMDLNFYEKGKGYLARAGVDSTNVGRGALVKQPHGGATKAKIGDKSYAEIGKLLGGKSRDYIMSRANIVLNLPTVLGQYCLDGTGQADIDFKRLTFSKARALARGKITDKEKLYLAQKLFNDGMTRNQLRKVIKDAVSIELLVKRVLREPLKKRLLAEYINPDPVYGKIHKFDITPEEVQQEIDEDLGRTMHMSPGEEIADLRKRWASFCKKTENDYNYANVIVLQDGKEEDTEDYIFTIQVKISGQSREEELKFNSLPFEDYATFKAVDDWAKIHGGYCTTKEPVMVAGKKQWHCLIKPSTLVES